MSAAHTPGPWKCIETEFGDYQTGEVGFVVSSDTERMVSSVANCRLIAAAPDLLQALNDCAAEIFDLVEEMGVRILPDSHKKALAAIAKATQP